MTQSPKQSSTQGIVLTRTDFGEADRILSFITPDHGKVKAIAKSVRKANAKLAGAIELFSVTEITLVAGRGEIHTLISARLDRHYGNIVKDLDRTSKGYEFIKMTDKATESRPESDYFRLLDHAFAALNDLDIEDELTELWFKMQLLKLTGHSPDLRMGESGEKLSASKAYAFNYDKMRFVVKRAGEFNASHIKFLRLGFGNNSPKALQRINNVSKLVKDCQAFIDTTLQTHVRV